MNAELAKTITEVKNQLAAESAKSLFLMNGGGAVALATWLQAVWEKQWAAPMLEWQLFGILGFAVGALLAGLAFFARFLAFYDPNRDDRSAGAGGGHTLASQWHL